MLIYNYQKEFLGIDAKDLQELGYHDLSSLRSEVTDFADLFVKTPGYIHNFQHVHWIDFIDCADDGEIHRVIINANGKNFTANLAISYAYLTDNPIEKAYLVSLHNLRALTSTEVEQIHDDILQRPTPMPAPAFQEPAAAAPEINTPTQTPVQEPLTPTPQPKEEAVETFETAPHIETPAVSQPTPQQEAQPAVQQPPLEDVYNNDADIKLDLDIDMSEEMPLEAAPVVEQTQKSQVKTVHKQEKFDNGYVYNPEVASKELGLPLDLIEEFIQDFIAQAGDFKPELYSSLEDGDVDNVKTLSHKLKGVAANLRIEDAFEVLTVINTTSDLEVIRTNLDLFYKIIAKLAGEEIHEEVVEEVLINEEPAEIQPTTESETEQKEEENDEFTLEFKDEEPAIEEPVTLEQESVVEDEIPIEFKDDDLPLEIELSQEEVPSETPIETTAPKIEINYSKEKIANEIGLDIESFNELFNDYIDETRVLTKEMQEAASIGDFELLQSEVMKLKGMSDNMRITSLNSEIDTLMQTTDSQKALELIDKIHDILEELSKVGA